jgi:hypothetical protein
MLSKLSLPTIVASISQACDFPFSVTKRFKKLNIVLEFLIASSFEPDCFAIASEHD